MTFTEFNDAVMSKLEEHQFDKVINHYKPPAELASLFFNRMMRIFYIMPLGRSDSQNVEECAQAIMKHFNEITEEIFPSKRI